MSARLEEILQWSDSWLVVAGPPALITAGPDVQFVLEGLSSETLESAARWCAGAPLDTDLTPELTELRDLFVGLGALEPVVTRSTPVPIVGSAGDDLRAALKARGIEVSTDGNQQVSTSRGGNDLTLVFRTETNWPPAPPGVHLAVDLTHHHTLVLGPLVVPGATSCLGCLDTQTTRRWGPDQVPEKPAIQRWPELTAELIGLQLELAQRGESPLVNATISWDLASGTTEREDLLRAPGCGGQCRSPMTDSLDLPWISA